MTTMNAPNNPATFVLDVCGLLNEILAILRDRIFENLPYNDQLITEDHREKAFLLFTMLPQYEADIDADDYEWFDQMIRLITDMLIELGGVYRH